MKFSVAALSAALAVSVPLAASAQQGYTWSYDRYITHSVYDSTLSLVYGVPQTDDVQFAAHCVFGAQGPFVRATIGADIGQLPQGFDTVLHVNGDGYQQSMNATVVRHEEFLHGVEFPMTTGDQFMRALAGQSVLNYMVDRQRGHQLGLRGSAGPVRQFASECANIQQLTRDARRRANRIAPLSEKQAITPKPGDFGCNLFPGLASRNSDTPQSTTFVNHSDGYRVVMWLDFNGQPVEYATLNPGESVSIDSFLTHPWMFTDAPGNCIQIIDLQPGVSRYSIAAASPIFGAE